MRLVSFDALRVLGFPNTTLIKPEHWLRERERVRTADWVLFPAYWQLPPLVFGLNARIFPSLGTYITGHTKVEMTRALEAVVPSHLPTTLIAANTPNAADEIFYQMLVPFVAKTPKSSMGDGVFMITNERDWRQYLAQTDIIYAQEYLPIDRDLRVVWVGDRVIDAYWRIGAGLSFRNNVAKGGQIMRGPAPEVALDLVARAARALGIDHAGFDVAMVGGHPYILEFNRLFGTRGVDGHQLRDAILGYLHANSAPRDPDHPQPAPPVAV